MPEVKPIAFIDYYQGNKALFQQAVIDSSKRLGIHPNDLMFVMWFETAGTLNPAIQNTKYLVEGQPATGLIQFVKSTAESLGTSIEALKKMSGIEQLKYVEKYLKPFAGRMKNYVDVYLAVFFPAAVGKLDNFVIETKNLKASTVAQSNPVFDLNHDKKITIAELKQALLSKIPTPLKKFFTSTTGIITSIGILFGLGWLINKAIQ